MLTLASLSSYLDVTDALHVESAWRYCTFKISGSSRTTRTKKGLIIQTFVFSRLD